MTRPKLRPHPSSVPHDARWNAAEREWEHGEKIGERHVGRWRWWRADGSLLCESTFDESGLLHGEFARYHPDGTRSRHGTFARGEHVGDETFLRSKRPSREHFPVLSRAVAKVVLHHDGGARDLRCYDASGREVTEAGVLLSEWRNDGLFDGVRPQTFLYDGFEEYVRAYHALPKRAPRVRALDDFEEVWGLTPPEDLVRFVQLTAHLGDRVFEARPSFGSPVRVARTKNLVEDLVLADQRGHLPVALVEPLGGIVRIAEATTGDTWHFGLFDHLHSDARGQGQVYLFNREEHSLCDPISPDLSTFAYLNCVCDARARGVLSPRAFARAYKRLKRKVAATWHFDDLAASAVPDAGAAFRYKSGAILPRFMFFRSLWIGYLLRSSSAITLQDMPRVFVESANEPITEQSWKGWLERIPTAVPTALYVLFRCFFFDDEARLSEAVRVCAASPSRLIRDGATLVSELQDGRKTLGTIRNMKRLKADFMSLGLDPNKREQRARARQREEEEEQEWARRGALQTPSRAPAASTMRAIHAGASLEDLAWEKLDDPQAHEEIVRAMRDREELRDSFAIIDYVDHDAHAHDNLILEHEREEALLALGEIGSPVLVPILIGRARRGDRKAVEMLASLNEPRATPHLLGLLDGKADRYHHFDTAVVHALRRQGARAAVPKLLAILARNPLVDWRSGIERRDLVQEVVLALGAVGDRAAVPALLKVLAAPNAEYDEVHPLAAGALGALGAREALGPLAQRLERTRDAAAAEDIWAYGELASRHVAGAGELRDARARLASLSSLDPAAEVVRAAALVKLGADRGPFVEARAQALGTPGHRKVDTARQRVWAWRCFGEIGGPVPDVHTIRQYVTTDEHDVRAAASKALARQGVGIRDARPYFLFALDALEKQGGLSALHAAVRDPWGVFRYNVALRLARIGDRSSVRVLCGAMRELYEEPVTSTYEYDDPPFHVRWFARALGSFADPEGTACLIEGLSSQNHHVRQVIASDPPKDDRVIAALVRLLDDPRAVLRSRAQHALEAFKRSPAYTRAMEERDRVAEL
jgi:hypothetical protein